MRASHLSLAIVAIVVRNGQSPSTPVTRAITLAASATAALLLTHSLSRLAMSTAKVCLQCGTQYDAATLFCPRDGSALKHADPGSALIGQVIADRYLVHQELGRGGMGQVFLAEQVRIGRRCALKVIREGLVSDPESVLRFNREASNAARISHPNVVQVYDFGEARDGLIFLAMEFIEGESLAALLAREGVLAPLRAVSIMAQVASALAAAHELKIVHRDLKPDNVMLARNRDGSDQVKVVDFGVSRIMDSADQKVTGTGLVIGTPEYMSPEQFTGTGIDGRSDLYSLAMILFRMLAGTPPFDASNAQQALEARFGTRPKRLAEANPRIAWPAGLQEVLDRAMAVHADERYQRVEEFSAAVVAVTSYWDPAGLLSTAELSRAAGAGVAGITGGSGGASSTPVPNASLGGASAPPLGGATAALASQPSSSLAASAAAPPPSVPSPSLASPHQALPARASAHPEAPAGESDRGRSGLVMAAIFAAVAVGGVAMWAMRGSSGEPSPSRGSESTPQVAQAPATDSATPNAPPVAVTGGERPQGGAPASQAVQPPATTDRPATDGKTNAAPAGASEGGVERPTVLRALARLELLTDSTATPQQAQEALRLAETLKPETREGRVELKYRSLEANILLDRTTTVCALLSQLRFEAVGTRFEGAVSAYATVARESCR